MFENIINFFKKLSNNEDEQNKEGKSKNKAKERLQLVLTQDRANVSADFLELMKQEIIDVIKKYIEVEENAIDVRITNKVEENGTTGSPSLYANIPILNIRKDAAREVKTKIEEKNDKPEETANKDENDEKAEKIKDDENEAKKVEGKNETKTTKTNVKKDTGKEKVKDKKNKDDKAKKQEKIEA